MITLRNPTTNETKTVESGFNVYCCLLAPFWFAKRGFYVLAIVSLILALPTFGVSSVFFGFVGNRLYLNRLKNQGWVPADGGVSPERPAPAPADVATAPTKGAKPEPEPTAPAQKASYTTQQIPEAETLPLTRDSQSRDNDLTRMIASVMSRHSGHEKAFTGVSIPPKLSAKLSKSFPAMDLSKETIEFAGLYSALGMKPLGIIITDKRLHYRWSSGFFGLSKCGNVSLSDISTLTAERKFVHPCYGGGNPGPDITINGCTRGWIQVLMLMSEEDEKVLLAVLNELAALLPKLKR